eukprot:78680_1
MIISMETSNFPFQFILCYFRGDNNLLVGWCYLFLCAVTSAFIHSLWFKLVVETHWNKFEQSTKKYKKWLQPSSTKNDQTALLINNNPYYCNDNTNIEDSFIEEYNISKNIYYETILKSNNYLNIDSLNIIFDFVFYSIYQKPWYHLTLDRIYIKSLHKALFLLSLYPFCKIIVFISLCYVIFTPYHSWHHENNPNHWHAYMSILYCFLYIQPLLHSWEFIACCWFKAVTEHYNVSFIFSGNTREYLIWWNLKDYIIR